MVRHMDWILSQHIRMVVDEGRPLTRSRMRKTRSNRERRELGRLMFSDMVRFLLYRPKRGLAAARTEHLMRDAAEGYKGPWWVGLEIKGGKVLKLAG